MASPQTAVNFGLAVGIPGELAYDIQPHVQNRLLNSSGQAQTFGFAFTENGSGAAIVGGTGEFAGILIQPKSQSSAGGSGGPTTTTFNLIDNTEGQLMRFGAVYVAAPAAAAIGDQVFFDNTTGAIVTQARKAAFTGVIAATTFILTVSSITAAALIKIGSVLTGTGVVPGTIITGQLTGTAGSNGTYSTNAAAAVSSFTDGQSDAAPIVGKQLIRNAKVDYFALTAAGTAVITITGV